MAVMYVGHIAAYRRTRSPGRLAWSEDRRPSGAGLRHDDSTVNIIIRIIIIIIIIIIINGAHIERIFNYLTNFTV